MADDSPIKGRTDALLNGQSEPGFTRTGPILGVEELVDDYLTGLPLISALTGEPVSEKTLERFITRAISDVEVALRIPLSPTRCQDHFDFKQADDQFGLGVKKLQRFPIIQIEALEICYPGRDPNDDTQYATVSSNWAVLDGDTGLVRVVPTAGNSFTPNIGFVTSQGYRIPYGGNFEAWPNMWRITYVAGFQHDRVPAIVNDLVGHYAACRAISTLGPLIYPANGYSIGQGQFSQSTSTMGPAFLAQRLQELTAERDRILGFLKVHFSQAVQFAVL
jgi:hypothetical protein